MSTPPNETQLEDWVNSFLAQKISQGSAAGRSPDQMQNSLNQAAWLLVVKLLRDRYDDEWPEGAYWLTVLAHILGVTVSESEQISAEFVAAGWLDAEGQPTAEGRALAGIEASYNA
ncbi:MAG: hypothetical protein ACO1RX_16380 [Candidatus Sericytochromatia bacterium]